MNEESLNNPLISVIIPCYSVENYLERCVESVVNQTYRNLEIILVDDGSPDRSGKLCDEWAKKDNRIKVIHKNNEGLGFARNSGMEVATGEFIAFVDSDDYIKPQIYGELIKKALDTNSDIVYCGHIKQLSNNKQLEICDFKNITTFEKKDLLELSKGFFSPSMFNPQMLTMSVWHAVYKKCIITQQFYSEREVGSEDIHFQVSAMLNANRVTFIPNAFYVYCYNGESLSHEFNLTKYERYKKLRDILNNTYSKYEIKNIADYCVFIMAFALVRRISLGNQKFKDKKNSISKIVRDEFWKNDHLMFSQLRGAKKIFYAVLKTRSTALMMTLSKIYCLINYSLAKKGLK